MPTEENERVDPGHFPSYFESFLRAWCRKIELIFPVDIG